MRGFKNKGFTLIELAIVLVIIGIIMAAILKGQELIMNARMKKFINDAGRKFEVAVWTFYDRNGIFPGDSNRNGLIDSEEDVKTALVNSGLLPSDYNPVRVGSFSFLVGLGSYGGKNVLVICPTTDGSTCSGTITQDELEFLKAFDTVIDGFANGTTGLVRSAVSATFDPNKWSIFSLSGVGSNDWDTTNTKALVYYFDRRPE
jgi:prepilin-type N-terminal cleavage/methylation domain-containing protein